MTFNNIWKELNVVFFEKLHSCTVMQIYRIPWSRSCHAPNERSELGQVSSCAGLTVLDVRNGAILLDVNIQSVGLKVLGDHHARLNDAGFLGEVPLAKCLSR